MTERYTKADVLRWQHVDEGRLPMKLAQLQDKAFQGRRDFVLSGLSLLHEGLGYTYVALGDPARSRGHFGESCQYVERLFELPSKNEVIAPDRLSSGYCLTWLIALAIGDHRTAASLAALFKPEYASSQKNQAAIGQIALALKSLIEGRVDSTQEILRANAPSSTDEFKYHFECLKSIAEGSQDRFVKALGSAASEWSRRIVKTHNGLPQAVCFIHGLGLQRLAESVFGKRLTVDEEVIPQDLF